jgi:hypothetical protein
VYRSEQCTHLRSAALVLLGIPLLVFPPWASSSKKKVKKLTPKFVDLVKTQLREKNLPADFDRAAEQLAERCDGRSQTLFFLTLFFSLSLLLIFLAEYSLQYTMRKL